MSEDYFVLREKARKGKTERRGESKWGQAKKRWRG